MIQYLNKLEEDRKLLPERTPLARIMGLTDLFNNQENSNTDARTIMDYIVVSANGLDGIVAHKILLS